MLTEKKFKTKHGYCHILTDRIILSKDGNIENVVKETSGEKIAKIVLTSGLITYILYFLFTNKGEFQVKVASIIVLVAIGFALLMDRNISRTRIIERNRIKEVKLKKTLFGLRYSRFEIIFENENGKLRRRIIELQRPLIGNGTDNTKAIEIMKEANLLL